MNIGACRITLDIPGNKSLKDKRRVVRSLCDRVRHRFKLSVAEVDQQENLRRAVIGLATVSESAKLASESLEKAANYAETIASDGVIIETDIDVFRYE